VLRAARSAPTQVIAELKRSAEMKSLITISLLGLFGLHCAFAGAIDDVVSKFDRHGLWQNGPVIPITEPETINANILAEKILTSYRKSSKELQILEQREISALEIGISGMKAMHVRVIRTSMYPPPAKEIA
jgi:hypothetical protein